MPLGLSLGKTPDSIMAGAGVSISEPIHHSLFRNSALMTRFPLVSRMGNYCDDTPYSKQEPPKLSEESKELSRHFTIQTQFQNLFRQIIELAEHAIQEDVNIYVWCD